MKKSFDTVGSIAILNEGATKKLAQEIQKQNKHIQTVLSKTGKVSGIHRTPKLKHITGAKTTVTQHKESGVLLKTDVAKVYFSPRTSTERFRIAEQVKKTKKPENILVLFSGIAPFPLVIEKHAPNIKSVTGIEINPTAHKYAEENLKINKSKKITLYKGDAKKILPKLKKFDRILMPLPRSSEQFLEIALKHLKKEGILHFYRMLSENNLEEGKNFIRDAAKQQKRKARILKTTKCGHFGPSIYRICFDAKIT